MERHSVAGGGMTGPTSIIHIQQAVARHYGIPLRIMSDRSIYRSHVYPRQVAMALAVQLTGHPIRRIADSFDRNHKTVRHALRQVERRSANDPETRRAIREVAEALS